MPKINDGGAAFPISVQPDFQYDEAGMSLRDFFAAQVACGMAAFSGTAGVSYGPLEIAGRSYEVADAMLAARSNQEPRP